MSWSHKHHEFCERQKMWGSTKNIANYLWRRSHANEPTEFEFEAKKFQRYIKRIRGNEYHRTTIPKSIRQLEEKSQGLFVILKDYGRGVYKMMVYPLSFLAENRNTNKENIPSQNASNPMFSEEAKQKLALQQQQIISKLDRLFRKVGLVYDADALNNIWRLSGKSVERVINSIELLLYRNSGKKIEKPHGFIIDCLKYRWSDGFDIYYEPELPKFQSRIELANYVSTLVEKILPKQIPINFQT